jgi:tRNA threonylcarbamoyladenosine biosynthesis protein TsaE
MDVVGHLSSTSPEQTRALGACLGRLLGPGHVVGLVGELGAGKTCLAAGAAEGMGVEPGAYVSSPTFTLVNEYTTTTVPLVHMDFYRLGDSEDLVEVGVDGYYRSTCACLVEWFDRFPEAYPSEHLTARFEVTGEQSRRLELMAAGDEHQLLGRQWADEGARLGGTGGTGGIPK